MKHILMLFCVITLLAGCDKSSVSKDEPLDKSYAYVTGCHPGHPEGVKWTQYNENGVQDSFILKDNDVFPVYKVSPGVYYATEMIIEGNKITFKPGNSVFIVAAPGFLNYIGYLNFSLRGREVRSYRPDGDDEKAIEAILKNHPGLALTGESCRAAPVVTGNHLNYK